MLNMSTQIWEMKFSNNTNDSTGMFGWSHLCYKGIVSRYFDLFEVLTEKSNFCQSHLFFDDRYG